LSGIFLSLLLHFKALFLFEKMVNEPMWEYLISVKLVSDEIKKSR
jgi:hypothetical protein